MTEYKFENLAFEGGGVKGYAYIGAVKELERLGIAKNIKRFSGTSIGAIFAAMMVMGYTGDELCKQVKKLEFTPPKEPWYWKVCHTATKFGIYHTTNLRKELCKIITDKKIDCNITLKQLYEKTKKDLVIVTCNLNRQRAVFLHHIKYPNVRLIDALVVSSSIPGFFMPEKHEFMGTKDYYVDGAVVDNYPIWVFNDLELFEQGKIDQIDSKSPIPETTLGLKLFSGGYKNDEELFTDRMEIDTLRTYIADILNTLSVQIEKLNITETYLKQTAPIYTPDILPTNFDISDKTKDSLIKIGQEEIRNYFEKKD